VLLMMSTKVTHRLVTLLIWEYLTPLCYPQSLCEFHWRITCFVWHAKYICCKEYGRQFSHMFPTRKQF